MAVYSTKELKRKSGSGGGRKLEMPDGLSKKIWLPRNAFVYHRVHFGIKTFTSFKNSKHDTLDCLNQTPGENGKGCPICAELDALWAKWREFNKKKDNDGKKEVMGKINRMVAEYFITNGIDLDDGDRLFQAVTFTKAKMADIDRVDENIGINNVIWLYKRSGNRKENRKIEYTLQELEDKTNTAELKAMLDELEGRTYEDGGPVDLEKAFLRTYTKEDYMKILHGDDGEESTPEDLDSDNSSKANTTKETSKDSTEVELGETTSLDELGLDDDPPAKKDPPKSEKKETKSEKKEPVKSGTDDLSLDGLDLEDLGEINLEESGPKMQEIDCDFIKKNQTNKDFIKHLYEYLLKEKKVAEQKDLKDQLVKSFAYVKAQGKISIPEFK